jgi:glycosyltransferase involved in cell wall biosynthesis
LIASKILRKNNLIHIHEIPAKSRFYSKFIVSFLNYFSKNAICVSKSVSDFWIKKGLEKNKIKIIYNGFTFKLLESKNLYTDKILFTNVSRIIPYKGHLLLIEIFEKLCRKNNKIYLQIVGDTLPQYQKYLDKLKSEIKIKGLDDKISLLGFRSDIMTILSKSSFFIHTPISPDPLPTVIFEAIESKTPIITNNLGGAYEILNNGKNGLIIENDSIDDSANKILSYLTEQKLQRKNVKNAYNYVCENFSLKIFKSKILNTIE